MSNAHVNQGPDSVWTTRGLRDAIMGRTCAQPVDSKLPTACTQVLPISPPPDHTPPDQ